jgi:release factor glutamine methyltransferase
LAAIGCVAPAAEAALLLEDEPSPTLLDERVARRATGEPLSWIVGWTRFLELRLGVGPGLYEPRPQTEALAVRAADRLPRGGRAADLCTGIGAIAAHLLAEDPTARVVGVDLDLDACRQARANGVPVILGDADAPLRHRSLDVVTAVAPYVPTAELGRLPADVRRHETLLALHGGADGLDVVRRVVATAGRALRSGGWLLLELGGEQDQALAAPHERHGFEAVQRWTDAEGDLRGVEARRR